MATEYSVELTLGYTGTDFTRTYTIKGSSEEAMPNVKSKILAYNANVPAADKKVFISDDYDASDPEDIIGEFDKIIAARTIVTTETKIV